jgi:pyruvate dehydrogenase E1 component alpha subunit
MPRVTIDVAEKIEYLSILNAEGHLDSTLEPTIEPEVLLKLHDTLLLARLFDERLLDLQRQGRIGTFPPIKGQEAAHLGAAARLKPDDWMVPSFRETAAELWRGRSLDNIIIADAGYDEAGWAPADSRNLPMAVPVGSQIPHAVGLAWAAKYRGTDEVVMAFFGDGATSEGDFHEGLNFAAVFQVPAVFVCQNNQWAISVPLKRQTHTRTLAQKAMAYGMPGIQVDGNDLLAVYVAAGEAVERARSGGGPTLIECVTYRVAMHTTADDPKRYRSAEEVAAWQKRDPLPRFQRYLLDKGILTKEMLESLQSRVMTQIQGAVEHAEEQMRSLGDPLQMFDHVYGELPPYLQIQKEQLARDLSSGAAGTDHG